MLGNYSENDPRIHSCGQDAVSCQNDPGIAVLALLPPDTGNDGSVISYNYADHKWQ